LLIYIVCVYTLEASHSYVVVPVSCGKPTVPDDVVQHVPGYLYFL
jgi:hypothetical protein